MRAFSAIVVFLSNCMSVIAGVLLVLMLGITLADVIMRLVARPLVGAYELVSLMGGALAGLAIPRAALKKAHVYVDLVVEKLPKPLQKCLKIITRSLVFCFFLFTAVYFVFMGNNFIVTKTTSMTLKVPFYPLAFCLAFSSLVQCLVSVYEVFSVKKDV